MRIGPQAPDAQPLDRAARQKRVPLEVVAIDEPAVTAAYERRLVLVRPDGHVAWRGNALADPHMIIDTVCGLHGEAAALTTKDRPSRQVAQLP
jgi:hypothetical protein